MKLIAQGAESKLYLEKNRIIKNRFRKRYRIKEIDDKLRKSRTKREAKVLEKLQKIKFSSPKLINSDQAENLEIEYIKGKLLKDVLENEDYKKLGKEIGEKVAILHNNDIIHGDLTTSNMILNKKIYFIDAEKSKIRENRRFSVSHENKRFSGHQKSSISACLRNSKNFKEISGISKKTKVFFIDFGLSFFSKKIEDRAVDLHLLKEALESKHYKIWEDCYLNALKSYERKAKNGKEVLKRIKIVESRGRYKRKNKIKVKWE